MKKLVVSCLLVAFSVAAFVLFYDARDLPPDEPKKSGAALRERTAAKRDALGRQGDAVSKSDVAEFGGIEDLRRAIARDAAARKRRALHDDVAEDAKDGTDGYDGEGEQEVSDALTDKSNRPKLTVREEQVMVMYDEMADVLEEHAEDCKSMSKAVDELIDSNERTISSWKRSQAELDEDALATSRSRVESAASERLTRLRQNLRVSLAKCKGDESLMTALGKLAALNE